MADIYAPIRAGSDIAFLGGLINCVIENETSYFKEYVVNYTNAATIINEDFQDTEDLDGVFSGLDAVQRRPDQRVRRHSTTTQTWQYDRTPVGDQGRSAHARPAQSGEQAASRASRLERGHAVRHRVRPSTRWSRPRCRQPPHDATTDAAGSATASSRSSKRHFARYTPEMVERVTGCPQETFLKVAETLAANSGPERTALDRLRRRPGPSTPTACR